MRFDRLDLNLLVALDILLETQSVSKAADRLNLTQPTLSAALNRLRDYFQDELLLQTGRTMIMTAKARELAPVVRESLNFIRFKITSPETFDPSTTKRCFKIIASDYVFDLLLSKILARAEKLAPGATFEIAPPGPRWLRKFENGDIDLMFTIDSHMTENHPHKLLFSDYDAVICWSRGKYSKGLNKEDFLNADHAVAVFGEERSLTSTDIFFKNIGIQRNISVTVPSFTGLARAVIGSNRIATLHSLHTKMLENNYPITVHPLPVEGPEIKIVTQWHQLRQNDAGVKWLLDLVELESRQFQTAS